MNKVLIALLLIFTISCESRAGSEHSAEPVFSVEEVTRFSKGVEKILANKGARAFIIARTGRPEKDLPKGIQFTHTAVAVYSAIQTEGKNTEYGYAIHNLYQTAEDKSKSFLLTDYPVDFFWGAKELKAGIIVPQANVQKRLIELIASQQHRSLHNPNYSVLANPHNDIYQNCTEFTLDMLNAAIYQTNDVARLTSISTQFFKPQAIHKSRFKLALGSTFMPDLSTRDHKRKVKTATFGSLASYMRQFDLSKEVFVIDHQLNTHWFK